jgi:CRISPR-associated endonuclease/helicase Cas3
MEALRQAGGSVEFLTADVTPADRLAAVKRIKKAESCLVVSTQCIEAGVDIDMDLVIRDFGPLDSLIQVAGRCNRNGERERGTVEAVLLREDDSKKEFASYIYTDKVLLPVTQEVLAEREEVLEEEVYPLTERYFKALCTSKDTGKEWLTKWAGWQEVDSVKAQLRGKQPKKVAFVVVENDPGLRGDLEAAQRVDDRWDRRRAFRRLAARVARLTVSVYLRDGFEPTNYGESFPPGKADDEAWFWLLRPGRYTAERGLDLGAAVEEQEGWGVIL